MPETIWDVADFYELLSVSRSATSEEIRGAITAQRRIWVRRQSSPDLDRRAEAELRPLEQAVIANPRDEEAKRILVTALFDSAMVVLSYGPRIGSRRQRRIVGDRLRRIKRLRMKDPRTKVLVGQLKEPRQRVRRMRWELVMSPGIYVGLVIAAWLSAVLMSGSRFGYLCTAILLGCLIVVFVPPHRKRGWWN